VGGCYGFGGSLRAVGGGHVGPAFYDDSRVLNLGRTLDDLVLDLDREVKFVLVEYD